MSSAAAPAPPAPASRHLSGPPPRRIAGIDVHFPLAQPLPSQMSVMTRAIASFAAGNNALLESPTGTGKTLALLSAALAFQHAARAECVLAYMDGDRLRKARRAKENAEARLQQEAANAGARARVAAARGRAAEAAAAAQARLGADLAAAVAASAAAGPDGTAAAAAQQQLLELATRRAALPPRGAAAQPPLDPLDEALAAMPALSPAEAAALQAVAAAPLPPATTARTHAARA